MWRRFDSVPVRVGGEATMLIDLGVGFITGVIGSLFYHFDGQNYCRWRFCIPGFFLMKYGGFPTMGK